MKKNQSELENIITKMKDIRRDEELTRQYKRIHQ